MRRMRLGVAYFAGALALVAVSRSAGAQQQRDPYAATLHYGTGLINIPVAWVSEKSTDFWVQTSGKTIPSFPDESKQSVPSLFNTNISIDTHWRGLFSAGVSAYSANPEYGFFGQVQLVKDHKYAYLPGVAVGARNLGKYKCEDRLLIGHDIVLQADSTYENKCIYGGFKTAPTLYGVATKDFALSSITGRLPSATMSISVGMGNGIFSDDGDLGKNYNAKGTIAKGLFLGTRFVAHPTLNSAIHFLVENDGWDWNAGLVGDYRGITLGVYGTELEEGGRTPGKNPDGNLIWNYRKLNLSLGYSGNIIDVARGVVLRTRITELTREQTRLRLDIAARARRIKGLEDALRKAQAGELADIAKRRQQLEADVKAERDAIQRANDRLRELERPPATPPSTPPTNPPTSLSSPATP